MAEATRARWVWPAVFALGVLVLAVIALNREPVELDPDTPEGAVQAYLQAISDSDFEAAFELLDPEIYDGCTPADLATSVDRGEPFTAVLDTENIADFDDIVSVPARMQFGSSGPFGNGWTTWETFNVTDTSGEWLIADEAWPYISWACREGDF